MKSLSKKGGHFGKVAFPPISDIREEADNLPMVRWAALFAVVVGLLGACAERGRG